MAFLADPLSIAMCLFVTGIGADPPVRDRVHARRPEVLEVLPLPQPVHLLDDLLVLGENLLVTFLGWEGVGTCSYLLISFWHTRESAATAGKKAFVTNRIGDWGFMLAMFLGFKAVGS
jgi:NADH-quinone oxidoreductase subunit L